jgi:hypothetical protein
MSSFEVSGAQIRQSHRWGPLERAGSQIKSQWAPLEQAGPQIKNHWGPFED